MKISKEKWNLLSQQEQEILKKLNIFPPTEKVVKTEKSYVMGSYFFCGLCEEEHVVFWKMSPVMKDGILGWKGKKLKVSKFILVRNTMEKLVTRCRNCEKNLMVLSKEELISKLLKTTTCILKED